MALASFSKSMGLAPPCTCSPSRYWRPKINGNKRAPIDSDWASFQPIETGRNEHFRPAKRWPVSSSITLSKGCAETLPPYILLRSDDRSAVSRTSLTLRWLGGRPFIHKQVANPMVLGSLCGCLHTYVYFGLLICFGCENLNNEISFKSSSWLYRGCFPIN
jgi:hypothetical protein